MVTKVFDRFMPPNRRLNPEALAWVAVIVLAIVMLAVESSIAVSVNDAPVALAFIVTIVHVGSMPLSMLRPLFGTLMSIAACTVLPLLGPHVSGVPWPWMVPMMITQIVIILIIGLRAHWGVALGALLGSIAGSAAAVLITHLLVADTRTDGAIVNILIYSCIAGGVYLAAVIIQQWQLIRSQLVQEKENTAEEHSKRVTIEEKARIARELHDIVAHSMSIINIQASSAPFRHAGIDPEVAKEFDVISTSARTALTEMRGLLSVLRNDEGRGELAPQPKFSEIDPLVDKARQAGVQVSVERSGEPIDDLMRDSTGLVGYRIIQEALSNAIRHARNSTIAIRIRGGSSAVWISVTNDHGDGPGEAAKHDKHDRQGLIGMRERAASVGGEIRTGATADGGFEVEAVLPLAPREPLTDGIEPTTGTPVTNTSGTDTSGTETSGTDKEIS